MQEEVSEKEDEKKKKEKVKKEGKGKGKKGKGKGKIIQEPEPIEELQSEEEEVHEVDPALWDNYLSYIDKVLSAKLIKAAEISLKLFKTEMNKNENISPLFEIELTLNEPVIRFIPTLDMEESYNFFKIVADLQEDINRMAEYMPRAKNDYYNENYYNDVVDDPDCLDIVTITLTRLNEGIDACYEYIKKFEAYSYLWLENRHEILTQFLAYGRPLTADEIDILRMDNSPGIKETPPTIKQFKEQIDFYEDLYKKLETLDTETIVYKWLRVNVKPLRQAILNTVCKWGNMYKQHLVDRVTNSLNELENFITEANAVMQVELDENDYDGLIKVMSYLQKVKDRQDQTDFMFEPLKEIIELLKNYEVEFSEDIHVQLQELPDKWNYCKKVNYFIANYTIKLMILLLILDCIDY